MSLDMKRETFDVFTLSQIDDFYYKENMKIENATVTKAEISNEHYGLTAWLMTEGKGWGQGYGPLFMDYKCLGEWIDCLLNIFEIEKFSQIIRKPCRVVRVNGLIYSVGNFLDDNKFIGNKN